MIELCKEAQQLIDAKRRTIQPARVSPRSGPPALAA